MKHSLAVAFWTFVTLLPRIAPGGETSELQRYLDSLAGEARLSGVVLVAKDGAPIASKAVGIANRATGAAIDLQTKFNLGSLNKMFTSVAIAQLAQAGRLKFTDTIGQHLPDYPSKDVAAKVTIHHLLTHTSGMGSYFSNEQFMAKRASLLTVDAHLPLFAAESLSFAPGEKFKYSNSGFIILGAIIEKLSGQSYGQYVRDHVYSPAGMNDTGFYEPGREIPNLAIGYTKMTAEGKRGEVEHENTDLREVAGGPAGGGYSTAGDLLKFQLALRYHKLLDAEHTSLITTGKVQMGSPEQKYGYGFGDEIFAGKRLVGHNGGAPGIAVNFDMFPDTGYTAVLMTNF